MQQTRNYKRGDRSTETDILGKYKVAPRIVKTCLYKPSTLKNPQAENSLTCYIVYSRDPHIRTFHF